MSCIWTFDKDANVLDTWYGRTVINSKYEFHYQQAQDIIDDSSAEQRKKLGAEYDAVRKDMLIMRDLFRILRDRRLAKGALELESVEIKFNLDQDKKIVGLKTKQELEVNSMIAEYMILANCYVAKFIYQHFPESALLRRHPLPRNDSFQEMIRLAQLKGFNIDTSSNKALAQSLSKAVLAGDETFNRLLKSLATLAMAEAEYFSTGSCEKHEFYHYGLAAEYYTHFTSPIRRYADVLVHRQLLAALESREPTLNNSALQSVAERTHPQPHFFSRPVF
jgi:DIS3-like exonuclease 1